jgi:hypothetical protein
LARSSSPLSLCTFCCSAATSASPPPPPPPTASPGPPAAALAVAALDGGPRGGRRAAAAAAGVAGAGEAGGAEGVDGAPQSQLTAGAARPVEPVRARTWAMACASWWLKVENPQLWGGRRRGAWAVASFHAAQAALRGV